MCIHAHTHIHVHPLSYQYVSTGDVGGEKVSIRGCTCSCSVNVFISTALTDLLWGFRYRDWFWKPANWSYSYERGSTAKYSSTNLIQRFSAGFVIGNGSLLSIAIGSQYYYGMMFVKPGVAWFLKKLSYPLIVKILRKSTPLNTLGLQFVVLHFHEAGIILEFTKGYFVLCGQVTKIVFTSMKYYS